MANPNIIAMPNFAASVEVRPSNISDISPNFKIRASSVGLNAKQEINFPELIDGAIDRTAYSLGGYMVEGDLSFPMIHEGAALNSNGGNLPTSKNACSPFTKSMAEAMWKLASMRDAKGHMKYSADLVTVYPDNSVFVYKTSYINQMSMKVAQQGQVETSTSWIGVAKIPGGSYGGTFTKAPNYLSPARIVTWQDFAILAYSDSTGGRIGTDIDGEGVREFNVTLNNNIDRAFTLNGSLNPQDVYARKRQINGSIKLLGRSQFLNKMGEENTKYFTSDEHIAFGYKIGSGNIYWSTVLHGILYKPEEMSLNPSDVFETTVNYEAAGDCGFSFEALEKSPYAGSSLVRSTAPGSYGGPSRDVVGNVSIFTGW